MADVAEKLNKIIEETHILKSALEAEDMDIAEETLKNRANLISALELSGPHEANENIRELLEEFKHLDEACRVALERFRKSVDKAIKENKVEQQNLQKNKKAHGHYQMQTPDQYSGGSIDHKK